MAMSLAEVLPPHGLAKVEIWASDLSLEMLRVAASAIYATRDVEGVSPARLRRFFLLGRGPREGSFRIVPEIRDLVKFRHLDLRNTIWRYPTTFTSSSAATSRSTSPRKSDWFRSTVCRNTFVPAAGWSWAMARSCPRCRRRFASIRHRSIRERLDRPWPCAIVNLPRARLPSNLRPSK